MKRVAIATTVVVVLCIFIYGGIAAHRRKVAAAVNVSLNQFFHVGAGQIKILDSVRALGPEAMPPLIQALSQTGEVASVAELVILNDRNATNSLPDLVRLLKNKDPDVRRRAANLVVFHIRARDTFAIPALITALSDTNDQVRGQAAGALKKLGPAAQTAVPALTKMLEDGAVNVRIRAASALAVIDRSQNPVVVPILNEAITNENGQTRFLAALSLYEINPGDARLIPVFVGTLTNKDSNWRINAANALRPYGAQANAAVPALLKMLGERNPMVQRAARAALQKINPEALSGATGQSGVAMP